MGKNKNDSFLDYAIGILWILLLLIIAGMAGVCAWAIYMLVA